MQRLDLGKSHFFRPLVHSSCLGFCHQGVFLCVVSKNDCQLPLTHIDFASAWWHYWHKLAFFLFTHRNVLSRTLVESARVMWHAVVRPEEQTHQSSKEHKAGFPLEVWVFWGCEGRAGSHYTPATCQSKDSFSSCSLPCSVWGWYKASVMPAQRSYVGNDQGNGPSIFYYFTEIMVVSFVNLTQNAAGRYWGGEHYDQWSMPTHKMVLLKEKKIRMQSYRQEEFFRQALWCALWLAWITVLLYLNLFQESLAPSPMPISLNSILCLPGFHLSGHLTK